jgi:hypothetical protein
MLFAISKKAVRFFKNLVKKFDTGYSRLHPAPHFELTDLEARPI